MEEMEFADEKMVIGDETVEVESTHLDVALILAGIITLLFAAYQLYARCVMEKAAKEMNQDTAHQRSSHAIVNGQVVY